MFRVFHTLRLILLPAMTLGSVQVAVAQQTNFTDGRYVPLNQYTPPGTLAQWGVQAGRICPGTFQQVRVRLPSDGTVSGYDGSPQRPVQLAAPAQMGLLVGSSYRFKLERLPEFPNQEFYPTIELVDQLHPPPGQAARFPVEVEFLPEELAWAVNGRMVTKVVYLEQPDLVPLRNLHGRSRVTDLAPAQNAVAEADALGRPIAIVRLGGRLPDANAPDPQFWGALAPLQLAAPPTDTSESAKTTLRPPKAKFGPPVVDFRTTMGPSGLTN